MILAKNHGTTTRKNRNNQQENQHDISTIRRFAKVTFFRRTCRCRRTVYRDSSRSCPVRGSTMCVASRTATSKVMTAQSVVTAR